MADVTIVSNRSFALKGLKYVKNRAFKIMGGKAETYAKQLYPVDTDHKLIY